jgi:CSLREA domain-containing protein
MLKRDWLRAMKASINTTSRGAGAKRLQRRASKLGIELLESRLVPATITVTSLADNSVVDGMVTLREAIQAANTDTSVDGSVAGNGADIITFAPALVSSGPATITLTIMGDDLLGPTALLITSPITIEGPTGANGITISGDASNAARDLRLFRVDTAGSLTLEDVTLSDGNITGFASSNRGGGAPGLGGAIYNQGTLSVVNSTLSGNTATGAVGGIYNGGKTGAAGGGLNSDNSGGAANGGAGSFGQGGGGSNKGGYNGGTGDGGAGGFGGGGGGGTGGGGGGGFSGGGGGYGGNFGGGGGSYLASLFKDQVLTAGVNRGDGSISITALTPAVPEPSTWAMMLAGFAGLGWLAHTRRRKTSPA